MYLSQLVLNSRQSQVYRELGNAHKFHQRIMQAFPDEADRNTPREDWHILFRQELNSDVVLVQSAIEPDWSKLPSNYISHHAVKPVHLGTNQVSVGKVFQFRLKANPSKRDKESRKTIGFYRREDQLDWLSRQGERHGFNLLTVDPIPSANIFGTKAKGQAPIRIHTVLFQGVLQVTDATQLVQAIQQGIGRGKSYGCGLLSIARLT